MENNDALNGQGVEPEIDQDLEGQPEVQPNQEPSSMETLLEEQGLDLDFPKQGEVRTGMIATITDNEIMVSVGTKSEGVISGRELEQIPDEERSAFEIGSEIPVYVVTPEDSNGNVVLSYTRAREENDWQEAERLQGESESFDSEIIGYNKGGLLVPLGRLRGFVPASQISLLRRANLSGDTPEQRWGEMVGEAITTRVIEVDRERRRLILSERAALQETRETLKDRLLEELSEGDIRTGRVTSIADFGAFVNIDGADGLVHLSELSWDRIQHPNEVLKVGQEVQVQVISIDRDRKRIGLSIRRLEQDPWVKKVEHLREGQLIEGKITHLTKFGAFARLDEELEGLIHISELSERRIDHPKEVVNEGDEVTLRIIRIDPERRRIGLSLRKVDSAAYSDLDWKMALAEEVEDSQDSEEIAAEIVAEAEEVEEAQEAEALAEPEVELEEEIAAEVVTEAEEVEEAQEAEEVEALAEPEAELEEEIAAEVVTEAEEVEEAQEAEEVEALVEPEVELEEEIAAEVVTEAEEVEEAQEAEEVEALAEPEAELEEEIAAEVVAEAKEVEEAQEEAVVEDEPAPEDEVSPEAEATSEVEEVVAEVEDTSEAEVVAEAEVAPDSEVSDEPEDTDKAAAEISPEAEAEVEPAETEAIEEVVEVELEAEPESE
jgi:small subunit ribosomal protein S1